MKNILLESILFLSALISCNSNKYDSEKAIYLTEEDIPTIQCLDFEKINLPEDTCMNSYFYVYHDTILIIDHCSPNPYTLSIMNMNDFKMIGNYLKKGNGPGEVIETITLQYGNRLNITDVSGRKIITFIIDSALQQGQKYTPNMINVEYVDFSYYDVLTDTSYVFYNSYFLSNCGNYANENTQELLVSGNDGHLDYKIPEQADWVFNCTGAFVITNTAKGKIFLAYQREHKYSLLKTNFDTIKIIYGPKGARHKYYKHKMFGFGDKFANNFSIFSYSTENNIFVANRRIGGVQNKDFSDVMANNRPEVFRFDWDGNLIARYQVPSGFCNLSFSESSNTLYITARNEIGELSLYKAKL